MNIIMTMAQLEFLSEKTHSQNKVAFGRIQDKADSFSFEHVSNKHKIREKQLHRLSTATDNVTF